MLRLIITLLGKRFKDLVLSYVKSEDQIADMFTKCLSPGIFEKNVSKLGMFDMYTEVSIEQCDPKTH